MGNNWSQDGTTPSNSASLRSLNKLMLENTSPFERLSLNTHLNRIRAGKVDLIDVLGIRDVEGANVIMAMAHKLVSQDFDTNILVAIGWLDGRLPALLHHTDSEWRQVLFDSACSAQIGSESIMTFEDLFNFVHVLVAAFDWNPANFSSHAIKPIDRTFALQLVQCYRSPAIRFSDFTKLLETYPYLLKSSANIWDRLLIDERTVNNDRIKDENRTKPVGDDELAINISRENRALLFISFGPQICSSSCLFKRTKSGFSMKAIELSMLDWVGPSIILIEGRSVNVSKYGLDKEYAEIDRFLWPTTDPPVHSTQKNVRSVKLAILVADPWNLARNKGSGLGFGFGGAHCKLILFDPFAEVNSIPPDTVFFKKSLGLGAGIELSNAKNKTANSSFVIINDSLQYGILQHASNAMSEHFQCRFQVEELSIFGVTNATA